MSEWPIRQVGWCRVAETRVDAREGAKNSSLRHWGSSSGDGADGVSRSSVSREAVQGSAGQLKSLREKRWDTIEILALPSLVTLSGTCYRGPA